MFLLHDIYDIPKWFGYAS